MSASVITYYAPQLQDCAEAGCRYATNISTCDRCKKEFCSDHCARTNHACVRVIAVEQRTSTDRDNQLLDIGRQCEAKWCSEIDFLPIWCEHCGRHFCNDHGRVEQHKCSGYVEHKVDVGALRAAMAKASLADNHPYSSYSSPFAAASSPVISLPKCSKEICKINLHLPNRCDTCRLQFCSIHFPRVNHACLGVTPPVLVPKIPQLPPVPVKTPKRIRLKRNTIFKNKPASHSTPTIRPSVQNVIPPVPPLPKSPEIKKHAKEEQKSKKQAFEVRQRKGVLSDRERQILASSSGKSKKTGTKCVIM